MQQQQAKSLPIIPTVGAAEAATLAVATAIKPSETPGSLAVQLITNKPVLTDDVKLVILRPNKGAPCRVVMLPVAVTDADALAGETQLLSISRDDPTKDTSSHSGDAAERAAEPIAVAMLAQLEAAKPRRNLASLVNAVIDAHDTEALADVSIAIVFSQDGEGEIKVYTGATAGDLTGKLGDVQMQSSEEAAPTPSIW